MIKKIDLTKINRDDFYVLQRDNKILIKPTHTKHRWAENELHLRSLVTDLEGNVLSSGFPKFKNYGEDEADGQLFVQALTKNKVTFCEKLDGSLIIVDQNPDRTLSFRTRGSHDLGDFHDAVMQTVNNRYPWFHTFFGSDMPFFREHSFLFEYVGPENKIVVHYDQSNLIFLDYVPKTDEVEQYAKVPGKSFFSSMGSLNVAPEIELPRNLDDLKKLISSWQGCEGVVAKFQGPDGELRRIKIKSDWYLRLHTLRFNLTPQKAKKLAYLLEVRDEQDIERAFSQVGIDHEGIAVVKDAVMEYIGEYTKHKTWLNEVLIPAVKLFKGMSNYAVRYEGATNPRKHFVDNIRKGFAVEWFPIAMKLYDDRVQEARLGIAAMVLDESVSEIARWGQGKGHLAEADKMLKIPATDEE